MTITSNLKNAVIYLRTWIKLIIILLAGLAIIGFIVFVVYKPMYSVSLNGKFIGYTEDKIKLQKKINNYLTSGDSKTVAFVEVDNYPEFDLCLLKKGLVANDDEIFKTVVGSGVPYYKYYSILDKGEEKYYVSSFEEAENIVQTLKDKKSQNQNDITYVPKYETTLKEFTDKDTVVSKLYIEMPLVKNTNVSTKKVISNSSSSLGISLIRPVSGAISSRFGSRSRGLHTGLDIATSKGTPIKAASAGTVVRARYTGSYGYMVVIAHTENVQTFYAHCSKIYVTEGQNVAQGDIIAAVGSTGNSTGPHLHLEIRVNGEARDPQYYLYNNTN